MKHYGYFDIHLYGADPIYAPCLENASNGNCEEGVTILLVGDIVDLKNSSKDSLKEAKDTFNKLKRIYGNKYLTGNHEVNQDEDIPLVIDGWGICHGDAIFNGFEESKAARKDKMGSGKLSRFFKGLGSKMRDAGLLNFHGKMTDRDVQARFVEYCKKYGITKGIICGHKHFTEKQTFLVGDMKFVSYPRGLHEITELY